MSMDVEMDAPAAEQPAAEVPEVDGEALALLVASLVSALPECASITVEGLDGDAPQVVCKPAEGEAMTYPIDSAALDAAIETIAADEAEDMAEGESE